MEGVKIAIRSGVKVRRRLTATAVAEKNKFIYTVAFDRVKHFAAITQANCEQLDSDFLNAYTLPTEGMCKKDELFCAFQKFSTEICTEGNYSPDGMMKSLEDVALDLKFLTIAYSGLYEMRCGKPRESWTVRAAPFPYLSGSLQEAAKNKSIPEWIIDSDYASSLVVTGSRLLRSLMTKAGKKGSSIQEIVERKEVAIPHLTFAELSLAEEIFYHPIMAMEGLGDPDNPSSDREPKAYEVMEIASMILEGARREMDKCSMDHAGEHLLWATELVNQHLSSHHLTHSDLYAAYAQYMEAVGSPYGATVAAGKSVAHLRAAGNASNASAATEMEQKWEELRCNPPTSQPLPHDSPARKLLDFIDGKATSVSGDNDNNLA